jgi:pimeloyl-ACP methyl ester carboxylesterase
MKRLTATAAAPALALALAMAGLLPTQTATAQPGGARGRPHSSRVYTPPPIHWRRCRDVILVIVGARCGTVTVPLSYAHPSGRKIRLAVSRLRHTSSARHYQGVVLTNPGGPGGSGLVLSVLGYPGVIPGHVSGDYDWIEWDPRGAGASKPSLSCDSRYFGHDRPNYVPTAPVLEWTWLQRSNGYAADCWSANRALLKHVSTTDTVADMESIRRALGRTRINFYGFSYGTYLAQVYATLHPRRVRRFVLDSNVDPRGVWYQDSLAQAAAFETAIGKFWEWLAAHDDVYHLGTDPQIVEKGYYAELAALATHPAAGGAIGPDELADVLLAAGYNVLEWEDLAYGYARAVNDDDYSVVREMYDGSSPQTRGSDNGYAMYLGTVCTDARWPSRWITWHRDSVRTAAEAPFATWGDTWFNAPCHYWPVGPRRPVQVRGGRVKHPILLVDETLDAATPFAGSLEVRKRFPTSSLIEGVGGTTHAGSLSGVACTDRAIAAYLRDGTVPRRTPGSHADLRCPPVPQPDPSPGAGTSQDSGSRTTGRVEMVRRTIAAAHQTGWVR